MAGQILDSPILLVQFKIHQMNWLFYAPQRSQQVPKWPLSFLEKNSKREQAAGS